MKRQASHHGILGGLALKFPTVRRSFKNVQKVFNDHAEDGSINSLQLRQVMEDLGARDLGDDEIAKLFDMADLDKSKSVEFREFLIAVSVGYYLKEDVVSDHLMFEENKRGFQVVKNAFEKIDIDHGGSVDIAELKKALFDVASSEESTDILENRFKELDFDSDGDIYFPEFLYGFVEWVGMGVSEMSCVACHLFLFCPCLYSFRSLSLSLSLFYSFHVSNPRSSLLSLSSFHHYQDDEDELDSEDDVASVNTSRNKNILPVDSGSETDCKDDTEAIPEDISEDDDGGEEEESAAQE